MLKYCWKRPFVVFKTGFTAFAALFLEVWMLLRVDWRYRFKDIDEYVYLPTSKSVLSNSPKFNFMNFGGYFESIGGTVAKIGAKTFIRRLRIWFFSIWCFIFYFCYNESIRGTVANIRAKTFFLRIWYWFYGIRSSICLTSEVITSLSKLLQPRYERKHSFTGFEIGFTAFSVLFLEL